MSARGVDRITARFAALKREGRGALVTYVMAGDPDPDTSRAVVAALPEAGADVIELGMPFTDPMADGPAIQLAGQRALAAGMTSAKVLDIVRDFRRRDETTPLILMGYFNPIFVYGAERFVRDAAEAGVDGLLIVDLPPEEDGELKPALAKAGLALIRLATPTTDARRLPAVLASATGFLYFVSITGITGGRTAELTDIAPHLELIRAHTDLPVAVGFGIKTGENVRAICAAADGAVVGTAIVNEIAASLDQAGKPSRDTLERVTAFVGRLAAGTK